MVSLFKWIILRITLNLLIPTLDWFLCFKDCLTASAKMWKYPKKNLTILKGYYQRNLEPHPKPNIFPQINRVIFLFLILNSFIPVKV